VISGLIFLFFLFNSSRSFEWQSGSEARSMAIPVLAGNTPNEGLWHPVVTISRRDVEG